MWDILLFVVLACLPPIGETAVGMEIRRHIQAHYYPHAIGT
jgi:hypothetical protein